ncbi:glycoside hydrolase family 95 protein [Treponema sp.]|uniref:glycoside hydrolase family 95 protein n=1 Tax=Treponema sp. TaxID=166 RepID=UPI003F0C4202
MKSIWYRNPAGNFDEAFSVGNGRIGATLFGGTGREVIYLNEESVWSGRYSDRNNESALKSIGNIRALLKQGREYEAQEQVFAGLSGCPCSQAVYKAAGRISIDFYDAEHQGLSGPDSGDKGTFSSYDSYRRELDFSSGICSSSFSLESAAPSTADFSNSPSGSYITFSRECFASALSDVLVYHISASIPKAIFLRLKIEGDSFPKKYSLAEDTVVALCDCGIPYSVMVTAVASGGSVFIQGDNLVVEKADDVTLYIDVESAYRKGSYKRKGGNTYRNPMVFASKCADIALKKICFASGASYETLRSDHSQEFATWNQHAVLSLENLETDGKSADEIRQNPASARFLDWNYSRYRLVSSCREQATLPSVGGGIWTAEAQAGNFNLRTQDFYRRSAGILGLERMNLPLFALAKKMYRNGKATARKMYGCQGFVLHGSTDIWGDSVPCGFDLTSSYSPLGACFLAQSVLDYYEYSLDRSFLRRNFYLLKDACDFFADYLVPVESKKFLSLCPAFTSGYETRAGTVAYAALESESENRTVKRLFECALSAMKYLGFKASSGLFIRYNSALQRIKCGEEENAQPAHPEGGFDGFIFDAAQSIISSRIKDGCVEISLLPNLNGEWSSGSLTKVCLHGNILADIKWKDGKFEDARLYTEPGTVFIKQIVVCYAGKKYRSQLSDGSLDIRNVLPTTV